MSMKKLLILFSILLGTVSVYAQNTAVTATVTDSDGTAWAGGTWKLQFVPNASQPNISVYNINGTPLSNSVITQNGTMNGTGVLSFTNYQNTAISPTGSSWSLTVCPNASSACGIYNFSTSTTTLNISSALTSIIPAPRFNALMGSYGYTDGEAITQSIPGSTYYNVILGCQKAYSGSIWSCIGGITNYISTTDVSPQSMAGPLLTPGLVVSVLSYGAACDGSTDDSAAFNAALATGKEVLVPAATCVVKNPVYFGGSHLVGMNPVLSVIKWAGANPTFGAAINSASVTANVATITTATAHGIQPNETACIQGNSISVFNGCFFVSTVPTATTYTFALTTANTSGSGGTTGMFYVLNGSKLPNGSAPGSMNYNAGWLANLTVQCWSAPGVSGIYQFGDNGSARNLRIQNCTDGYTSEESYMTPLSHVVSESSSQQGFIIKDVAGTGNGATYVDSLWANGYGSIGVHVRATPGRFTGLYAQQGGASALYGIFLEGDSGNGAWARTASIDCVNCTTEVGSQNAFRVRRYYFELDSPTLITGQPSQDHFVFDDAWGSINFPVDNFIPAGGYYNFRSLGNVSGVSQLINIIAGGGIIEPTHLSDFAFHGFNFAGNTWTTVQDGMFQTGTTTWNGGASAPSGSCAAGSIYTNGGATSTITTLYVCYPANTWTAVIAIPGVTGYTGTGNVVLSATPTGTGTATWGHFKASGTPTIACNTGAGASPSVCTITGNDEGGVINITTGSAPANSAIIATVTLGNACPTMAYPIIRSSNANASQLTGNSHDYPNNISASQWSFTSNSAGLSATTAYAWNYQVRCN
jgi:hypothetical protein